MMLQAVAHDVKNKLAELAMRLMDRDIEAAALALDSADKLSQALLLDDPNQLVTHIDAACPADLVEEIGAVYSQLFADKQLSLQLDQSPTLWYYDVNLMRLALSNIVDNALKHCERTASLRMSIEDEMLVFEIRNDGEQFPDEVLSRDWTNHTPLHSPVRKSTGHSTGMGMLLAHKIVQAHRLTKDGMERCGSMKLRNDCGAVVSLRIP